MAVLKVNTDAGWENVAAPDLPIGTVIMWPGAVSDIPNGWLVCDGTTKPSASYQTLANLLGDGSTSRFGATTAGNFTLPPLTSRMVRGSSVAGTISGSDSPSASTNVTITNANIPGHTHSANGLTTGTHSHSHTIAVRWIGTTLSGTGGGRINDYDNVTGGGGTAATATYAAGSSSHSHSWTGANSGSSGSGTSASVPVTVTATNGLPAYVGMIFIVRAAAI